MSDRLRPEAYCPNCGRLMELCEGHPGPYWWCERDHMKVPWTKNVHVAGTLEARKQIVVAMLTEDEDIRKFVKALLEVYCGEAKK